MIKILLISASAILFTTSTAYCQETLDAEKYKEAELFAIKKGYDVPERLQEIEILAGKEVTVYEVSGKQNKIKLTYTGVAEITRVPKLSDKDKATLITVRASDANGRISGYFPLTNSDKYRIYLTEKMK
jgi:hypothetical protein